MLNNINNYQIISDIYENEQNLLDEELKDLDYILTTKKNKIKELSDAKFQLYKTKRKDEHHDSFLLNKSQIKLESNSSMEKFSRLNNQSTLRIYNNLNARTNNNTPLINKKNVLVRDIKTATNSPNMIYRSFKMKSSYKFTDAKSTIKNLNNSLIIPNLLNDRKIRKKYIKLERILKSIENEKTELNNLYKEENKKKIIINKYKEQRLKRTANIIDEIEEGNPEIIKQIYKYKMKSIMDSEEAYYHSKINFHKLLKDPNRIVAKIEKKKCSQKEISRLLGKNRYNHV